MKTIKLNNNYSAFFPASTPYSSSSYINPLADSSFHWTATAEEEKMLEELDAIFARKSVFERLNTLIGGQLCFYHSEYRFAYSNEKVVVTVHYKGHRYLSVQEKLDKGYDIDKVVGAAGSIALTQSIEFEASQDEAGTWKLIIEDHPTIIWVEFINGAQLKPQDRLFNSLYEKYRLETNSLAYATKN